MINTQPNSFLLNYSTQYFFRTTEKVFSIYVGNSSNKWIFLIYFPAATEASFIAANES